MKIDIIYSCSDYVHHEHKTKLGAWICGRWQYVTRCSGLRYSLKKAGYWLINIMAFLSGHRYFDAYYSDAHHIIILHHVEDKATDITGECVWAWVSNRPYHKKRGKVKRLMKNSDGQYFLNETGKEPAMCEDIGIFEWYYVNS